MRVLIACEFSGIVRNAFGEMGHDVLSVDFRESELPGNHYVGDVRDVLSDCWDLLIAFPPCQYLSYAGNRHWNLPGRAAERLKAMDFFLLLYNSPVPKVCIENPVGYPNESFRKPNQIIHPYYFGTPQLKRTCLWLRGLRCLNHVPENTLFEKRTHTKRPGEIYRRRGSGKLIHFTEAVHGARERSRTDPGIAKAMASQWGVV